MLYVVRFVVALLIAGVVVCLAGFFQLVTGGSLESNIMYIILGLVAGIYSRELITENKEKK